MRPSHIQCSTFMALPATLALKLFRGEPAISGFVWNFTPRFYFTPLPGFFSPFPHGTGSLSLTREYLAFRDGPRSFRQDSSCPDVLRVCLALLHDFGYGSFTLFAAPSPALLLSCRIDFLGSPITPSSDGLGSSAFARHYLRNRFYFLLLQVLRCFSSLRIASP